MLMFLETAVVTPTGGSTHQEANFSILLEPKLRKLFYETYDEVPEEFSKVFHVQTSKKAMETDFSLGAMPQWGAFGSGAGVALGSSAEGYGTKAGASTANGSNMPTVPYVSIVQGTPRTYIHNEFAQGFMVERKLADDEMYSVIEKMPKDLARAGRYKVETDAASLFNNAFATNGYDGVPLFSDAHPLLGYKDATGAAVVPNAPGLKSDGTALVAGKTSNLILGALSDTTLKAAMLKMKQQCDEAGKLVQFKADTLVVPPTLEFTALELIRSSQKVGTADNDVNVLQGSMKVVVLDFLTSTTAWFVMDSKRHQLNFFWRTKPEFKREEDFDSLVAKYRGYMRYSLGYSDFRGLVGSAG